MGSAVRILSLGGIPIYVHANWLAVYALTRASYPASGRFVPEFGRALISA